MVTHDLNEAIERTSKALGLSLTINRSVGTIIYTTVKTPTDVPVMEIMFTRYDDRGWIIGGVAWIFDFQKLSHRLFDQE